MSKEYLLRYADDAEGKMRSLEHVVVEDFNVDVRDEVLAPFMERVNKFKEDMRSLEEDLVRSLQELEDNREVMVEEAMRKAEAHLQGLYESVVELETKQEFLISNRERILNIIRLYNINPSEYTVDIAGLSKEEILEMYTIAEYALNITVSNDRFTDKLLGLIYKPLDWNPDDPKDTGLIYGHFAALVIVAYFAKPYFFGVVGALYMLRFVGNTFRVRDKKKLLSLAYNIAVEFDFREEFKEDPRYLELLKKAEDIRNEDYSADIEEIYDLNAMSVKELEDESPIPEYEEAQRQFAAELPSIEEYMAMQTKEAMDSYMDSRRRMRSHLDQMRIYLQEMSDSWSFLGDEIKLQKTLDMNFRNTLYQSSSNVPMFEDVVEMELANHIFKWKYDTDKREQIDHMKYWIINALSNVKEKHITLDIVDKAGAARDMAEFLDSSLSKVVQYKTETLEELISKDILPKLRSNVAKIGNKTIQEYNAEAEESGLVTIDYRVIAILSCEDEDPALARELRPLLEYSARYGVIFLVLAQDESMFDERELDNLKGFDKGCAVSKEPYNITCLNGDLIDYTSEGYGSTPYRYSHALGTKVIRTLVETIEADRSDILDYENGYRSIHIPDEKIWSWNTRKGIELRFGYLEGDPTKPYGMTLGDDAVHCLMAGATGAGKSATINQILANLFHMYPPEELEMVMIDFKNVEFAMYTGDNLIPHAKIISGTKDGEYAVSVFDYLIQEMDRRTEIFAEAGVQKLEDYNNIMEEKGEHDKIMPRVLFLIDEYQVMFTEVPDKILDVIKTRIASLSKLARFCGCHMWFTSQSMKGTMGPDIMDQFKLRAALGCSEDVSIALIGNKAAAQNIKSKGFIYTNHTAGQDETANKLWRIPFIPGSYINTYLPKLIKLVEEQGRIHRRPDFYNEKTLHGEEDFFKALKTVNDLAPDKTDGLFILGERTSFSLNKIPVNFKLKRDDGEHVICSMFERDSMLNMANTFLYNLEAKGDSVSYVVHCCDNDTKKLLDLENRVPQHSQPFLNSRLKAEDIIGWLQQNIQHRRENPELQQRELYFVGINWEKLDKLGRNSDYGALDKLKLILQDAAPLNIHLVLLLRETKDMRTLLGGFNHKFISYHNDTESMNLLDDGRAKQLQSVTAVYARGSSINKFKLYQFPIHGTLAEAEIFV